MSTDKTLADVQPGWRLRLGDGVKECARRNCKERTGSSNEDCTGCGGTGYRRECNDLDCVEHGCCGYGKCYVNPTEKVLSAQPSPGGQRVGVSISDDDRAVLQRLQDALPTVGVNGWPKGVEVLERLLRDSLAARQPVGQEPVGKIVSEFRDTGGYSPRIEWANGEHPGVGTELYAAPTAQAVDLGQFRGAVVHWYADADNANTNPAWVREEASRLLAVIDNYAEVQS